MADNGVDVPIMTEDRCRCASPTRRSGLLAAAGFVSDNPLVPANRSERFPNVATFPCRPGKGPAPSGPVEDEPTPGELRVKDAAARRPRRHPLAPARAGTRHEPLVRSQPGPLKSCRSALFRESSAPASINVRQVSRNGPQPAVANVTVLSCASVGTTPGQGLSLDSIPPVGNQPLRTGYLFSHSGPVGLAVSQIGGTGHGLLPWTSAGHATRPECESLLRQCRFRPNTGSGTNCVIDPNGIQTGA